MATILIVDDRPSNRQFLLTLLGYGGHRLLEAGNGAQGLELARKERPDLVITDILMPTMDGFEFVQQIRSDADLAQVPVIFHTATYSAPEAHMLAQSCGVEIVLPKPSDPQVILAAVAKALGMKEVAVVPDTGLPPAAATSESPPIGNPGRRYLKDLKAVKLGFDEVFDHSAKLVGQRDLARGLSRKLSASVESMQRVMSRLSALVEVGMEMEGERDPAKLVRIFFVAACDIIPSAVAALAVLDEKETAFRHVCAKGIDSEVYLCGDSGRNGLLGTLLSGHGVVRTREIGARDLPELHPPARNLLALPVASAGRVYGWLYFAEKTDAKEFSAEDERLAGIMATKLALLYENHRLYDDVQRHSAKLQLEVAERRRAQKALQESQAGLRRAQSMAKIAHVITGVDGAFEKWSDTLPSIVGLDDASMPATTREWLALIHPDDRARFRDTAIEAGRTGNRGEVEYRVKRHRDWIHVHQVLEPLEQAGGAGDARWFNTLQDVTERKRADARIKRLNRVYAVLSGINSLIVRIRDRDRLFHETCRIAVEHGHFNMAWIGLVDTDAMKVKPIASAGAEPEFLLQIRDRFSLREDDPDGNTMSARAIRGKKAIVLNDISNDPRIYFLKERIARGIRSIAVLPLLVSGEAIGIVTLYADEIDFFDEEEMKLLHELAGDIAFALEHIEKSERADYLACYDELTGLANRKMFLERLGQYIHVAKRGQSKVAVVLLDIERLRTVNESLGRHIGDRLLREMAKRLVRGADQVEIGRVSADHFVVVLQEVKGRSEVVRRIQQLWHGCFDEPYGVDGSELKISARAGVALFPSDSGDAESMLVNAEAALRKAKSSGERFVFFDAEMTARVAENLVLESKLRQALEKEEFVLHYQPKVDLETRRIVGVEALIRWQSPERGLVAPMLFIPLLEETGLILEVGGWALRRAVLDHRHWLRQGVRAPRIAVNVSQIQLRQRDFVEVIRETVAQGANPTGIDLEITESLLMSNVADNIGKLKAVCDLGLKIAIDDFGTGYSSLGYLAQLPVHMLKIDRSFIIKMLTDPNAMTLVQTIITLAHSLRLSVVAEGVEQEDQAKILRLLRCDEMQGYLISKPLPIEELTLLLRKST